MIKAFAAFVLGAVKPEGIDRQRSIEDASRDAVMERPLQLDGVASHGREICDERCRALSVARGAGAASRDRDSDG